MNKMSLEGHIASFRALQKTFFQAAVKDGTGELYLYDAIGSSMFGGISAQDVVKALEQMKKEGCTALNLYINSPGGDVFDGVAMYNCIKRFEGTKNVMIDGLAASAASLVALAGDNIVTAANGMWMIHDPWGFAIGNSSEMRKTADTLDQVGATLLDTYALKCGAKCPRDELKKMMMDETWMTAEVALKYGLTDTVLADADASEEQATQAAAHPILSKFTNTPEDLKVASRQPAAIVATMKRRLEALRVNPKTGHGQPARKK